MNKNNLIIFIFFLASILGCKENSKYINESGSCELILHTDSTYEFTFPNFFGPKSEIGTFEITNDRLNLFRKSLNDIDSINTSCSYPWDKAEADSLLLRFRDLHHNPVHVKIQLNNFSQKFETTEPGIIHLTYQELEGFGIVNTNEKVEKLAIEYLGNYYIPDLSYFQDSERPKKTDFTLNQFVGQEYAILNRNYRIEGDTIYINDISRKSLGRYKKLIRQK